MFSRYGVNYLVQLHEAQAAASRRAPETRAAATPSAAEEIGIFLRLGGVIAVIAVLSIFVAWAMH